MEELFYKNYLNNISDLIAISKNKNFESLINNIDKNKIINVNSHLIHKETTINPIDQFIFNLDNYITFVKSKLFINQFDIQNIIDLTIYNEYNKILYSNIYYYDDTNMYLKEYKKMLMYNYNKNINLLKKYITIDKLNFESLISYINTHKKRPYIYFENINQNNIAFYIELIN